MTLVFRDHSDDLLNEMVEAKGTSSASLLVTIRSLTRRCRWIFLRPREPLLSDPSDWTPSAHGWILNDLLYYL